MTSGTTTLSCRIGRRAVNKDQAEIEKYATGTNSTPPKVPEDNHAEDAFHRDLLSIKTTDPSKLIIIVIIIIIIKTIYWSKCNNQH